MGTFKCLMHKDKKPGMVLKFSNGDEKLVMKNGAHINVVKGEDGKFYRAKKPLSKKERRRARKAQTI